MFNQSIKSYFSSIILVSSIFLGGIFAIVFKEYVHYLKPLGELFLNLILTAIVPLIFFSVSSAIARTGSLKKLGQIISAMAIVFILTSIVASIFALIMVKIFPPGQGVYLQFAAPSTIAPVRFFNQLVNIVTVSDFSKLFSHDHILPLIVFSILVGLASSVAHEKGKAFAAFLQAGEAVFMQVFALIMLYAPIGFFAYFAGKLQSVRLFWQNIFLPMITSFATCSSAASIPANLVATKAMGVPPEIYETVVPLGTILHKEGSVIGGVIKIAFLFSVFHLDFSSMSVLMTAVGVSLLVGTVMGAIPSGGMLGELLILSVYGFPAEALVSIVAISIVIDPFATLLNVTGNTASSLLIARWVEGKER